MKCPECKAEIKEYFRVAFFWKGKVKHLWIEKGR
jgi:hypothetical protein